jgi:hypothetical protein
MLNSKVTERVALLGAINPSSQAAGALSTGWCAVANFDSLLAILQAGALGSSATMDAKLQQAQDSSGTGAKDVTGKAITQWLQATADKSNKQALIGCRVADLDTANNFTHVRLTVTVATAASLSSAALLGVGNRRGGAATNLNAASVAQVV